MLRRLLLALSLALAPCIAVGPAIAATSPPISCPPGSVPDPRTGQCRLVVSVPEEPGSPGQPGGGGTTQPVVVQKCLNSIESPPIEVPCASDDGWWSNGQNAYCKVRVPQPPFSDPVWEGHTDGQVYECLRGSNRLLVGAVYWVWLATPPNGAPPDPRVLARQAMASMQLQAINIGLVPEPRPGSVGLVGMPNWMWVDAPTDNTWGPITRSASAAGYTVTATAKVSQVNWDMGDGQVVSCGAGTAYQDSFGRQSSPTCGHTYTRQGSYTVRATSHWVITWSGIGQSGTITMDLTDSVPVTIGEAQVLKQ